MNKKIKLMIISDHILAHSGVANATHQMINHLHKTGKYQFICLGGAVSHKHAGENAYRPQKIDIYGDDLIVYPVDGYGNPDIVRSVINNDKPDILWFMTDPRFYQWLWDIEDEIRAKVPMVYYHVWDNYPYPMYNKTNYLSNDVIATISKVTDDIVKTVAPEVESHYIPHSVDLNIFKKLPNDIVENFRKNVFPKDTGKKFTVFWNSRNARRKNPGSVVWWFSEFLDKVGKDKARLIMHTDPKDPHGPDLEAIIVNLKLTNGEVLFSNGKMSPQDLALMYNLADVTVALSDAEGFGYSASESLACETPIIVTMTGGLQEQVTDGKEFFGFGLPVASQMIVGSQEVSYIYEDRVSKEDYINSLTKLYEMSEEERNELGKKGRQHLQKNYNPEILMNKWDELLTKVYNERGSWETRKKYDRWEMSEIK